MKEIRYCPECDERPLVDIPGHWQEEINDNSDPMKPLKRNDPIPPFTFRNGRYWSHNYFIIEHVFVPD